MRLARAFARHGATLVPEISISIAHDLIRPCLGVAFLMT